MAKKEVVWTATAVRQRREILQYWTARNGSTAYAEKLIRLIAKRVSVIQNNPEAFVNTIYPDTKISAIGHFSIVYRVSASQIIIMAFWDNRQDPQKLLEILK